jgi:hypothetical protein
MFDDDDLLETAKARAMGDQIAGILLTVEFVVYLILKLFGLIK